jgi:FixJ family two-component response regulator
MQILRTDRHDADALCKRLAGNDLSVAYALLPITLGINIALHGISRILAGPASFVGAVEFLAKPFDDEALLESVRAALES